MTLDLFREPAERGSADGGVTHESTDTWSPSLEPAGPCRRFEGWPIGQEPFAHG